MTLAERIARLRSIADEVLSTGLTFAEVRMTRSQYRLYVELLESLPDLLEAAEAHARASRIVQEPRS